MWHVEEADEIAQLFENIGLGRIEAGVNGEDDVFALHDLQYEYCANMRGCPSHTASDVVVSVPHSASGHALFLSSCESLLLSLSSAVNDQHDAGQDWAQF